MIVAATAAAGRSRRLPDGRPREPQLLRRLRPRPERFRGADYDPGPTSEHHTGGRNEYLLSETVLGADLVVNLPKLKTHKKTGVTLALKNLVGINGDKNWLPHHCVGVPGRRAATSSRDAALDRSRAQPRHGGRARTGSRGARQTGLVRVGAPRRVRARGASDFIRSGNWHGNRTTWRMCLDLNRCLYYSDGDGPAPRRAGARAAGAHACWTAWSPARARARSRPADRPAGRRPGAGTDPVARGPGRGPPDGLRRARGSRRSARRWPGYGASNHGGARPGRTSRSASATAPRSSGGRRPLVAICAATGRSCRTPGWLGHVEQKPR